METTKPRSTPSPQQRPRPPRPGARGKQQQAKSHWRKEERKEVGPKRQAGGTPHRHHRPSTTLHAKPGCNGQQKRHGLQQGIHPIKELVVHQLWRVRAQQTHRKRDPPARQPPHQNVGQEAIEGTHTVIDHVARHHHVPEDSGHPGGGNRVGGQSVGIQGPTLHPGLGIGRPISRIRAHQDPVMKGPNVPPPGRKIRGHLQGGIRHLPNPCSPAHSQKHPANRHVHGSTQQTLPVSSHGASLHTLCRPSWNTSTPSANNRSERSASGAV